MIRIGTMKITGTEMISTIHTDGRERRRKETRDMDRIHGTSNTEVSTRDTDLMDKEITTTRVAGVIPVADKAMEIPMIMITETADRISADIMIISKIAGVSQTCTDQNSITITMI